MIHIPDLPEAVNVALTKFVSDLKFWVQREREKPTPAEARASLSEIEVQTSKLLSAIEDLDYTPRAHLVAKLQRGGLREITDWLYVLRAAVHAAGEDVPVRLGNVQRGVPRYAADRVAAIFKATGQRVTISKEGAPTPAMRALQEALTAAGYSLSMSSITGYLKPHIKRQSGNQSQKKRRNNHPSRPG